MHTHTHKHTHTHTRPHKPGIIPRLTCSVLQPVTLTPAHRAFAALSLLNTLNWTNPATNSPGKEEAEKRPRTQRTKWKYLPFDQPRNSLNQQVSSQPVVSIEPSTFWQWRLHPGLEKGKKRPSLHLGQEDQGSGSQKSLVCLRLIGEIRVPWQISQTSRGSAGIAMIRSGHRSLLAHFSSNYCDFKVKWLLFSHQRQVLWLDHA